MIKIKAVRRKLTSISMIWAANFWSGWRRWSADCRHRRWCSSRNPKQVGLLLIWLWRLHTRLIDSALTISHDLIAGALRRAKNAATKTQQKQNKRIAPVLSVCGEVVEMLLDENIADDSLRETIFREASANWLAKATRLARLSQWPGKCQAGCDHP